MKKLAIISGLAIVIVAVTYLLLPYETEMTYRESDRVRYHLYTPASIKQAPRISQVYTFSHTAANGQPASAGVCFSGVSDTAALKQYLGSLGYSFARKVTAGELWTSEENRNLYFTVISMVSPDRQVCLYESER
ncbi:hypothetical protein [Enterobacter mori]|uniref:hypothetical protein n=1 Tax=Enterobacter mori TaxID=539813 RepID=UPI001B8CE212|nr:hypothetical protein [Enterobacter mori]MBS3049552.1 hypothetical protein [Enterobacter mori]